MLATIPNQPDLINKYVGYLTTNIEGAATSANVELYNDILQAVPREQGNIYIIIANKSKIKLYDEFKAWCDENGYKDIFNVDVSKLLGKDTRVMCVDTGEIFDNPNQACKAHNLSYGQLNKHLHNMVGYKTVKHKVYKKLGQ